MSSKLAALATQKARGRSYKRALLKRKLLDIRKKHREANENISKEVELPLSAFNEQLFALCFKYRKDGVIELKKLLLRKYYQKITLENKCQAPTPKNTGPQGIGQKHLLDEIGHVKDFNNLSDDRVLLEKNLKKVATLGTVQLFNAINQCRSNYKKKVDGTVNPVQDNKAEEQSAPVNANENNINSANAEDNQKRPTTTSNNSLMHILRRRAKLSTENRTK